MTSISFLPTLISKVSNVEIHLAHFSQSEQISFFVILYWNIEIVIDVASLCVQPNSTTFCWGAGVNGAVNLNPVLSVCSVCLIGFWNAKRHFRTLVFASWHLQFQKYPTFKDLPKDNLHFFLITNANNSRSSETKPKKPIKNILNKANYMTHERVIIPLCVILLMYEFSI